MACLRKLFRAPLLQSEKHISDCSSAQTNSPHEDDHGKMRYSDGVNTNKLRNRDAACS
jgi:hypothetical protein